MLSECKLENIFNEDLVQLRDNCNINSFEWDAYNTLNAFKLEHYRPSYSEELMVLKTNLVENFLLNDTAVMNDERLKFVMCNSIPRRRSLAEYDDRYVQIIADAIIRIKSEKGEDRYLFMVNKRLNSPLYNTIGFIGGHVRSDDRNPMNGLKREILEEININDESDILSCKPFIFIIDNENLEISKRHLCCLYVIDMKDVKVHSNSRSEQTIIFTESELKRALENKASFNSWVYLGMEKYLAK